MKKLTMVFRLTDIGEIFGADLFDLVEAGVQVRRLFGQGGDAGHLWTDLLAVDWTRQTHTQQAGGQVCNTKAQHKPQAAFRILHLESLQ